MIMKEREFPHDLRQLQALIPRLPISHPKFPQIKDYYSRRMAGYKGEKSIEYHLSFLEESSYYILHNIRLQAGEYYFQMDALVICASRIFIIEVKNMKGHLHFDQDFKQLIRTIDTEKQAFSDPVMQVLLHKDLLGKWLKKKKLEQMEITPLIVVANPEAIISASSHHLKNMVIHRSFLHRKIEELNQTSSIPLSSIKKLCRQLKASHILHQPSLLNLFQIKEEEILKGVICPECRKLPMHRLHGTWRCPSCAYRDKLAHVETLNDFKALFRPFITIDEMCELLDVSSRHVARRLVKDLQLARNGKTKGTVYKL